MALYSEMLKSFQSTHPMRDATIGDCSFICSLYVISIHASHAGCDTTTNILALTTINFNPRIPCGMRRKGLRTLQHSSQFQSTHPMRDATADDFILSSFSSLFQSTHPMRDATKMRRRYAKVRFISIHASHAGCDQNSRGLKKRPDLFQSTHPMRDAT